ncbi:MAG TPA: GTPase Era [Tissierellia bacterium]|nr:GTPase Era [Tissierellia bacterium]
MSFKSGFVAIVGRANVGKSTLLNHLMGQKISIVTHKAQTTRMRIQAVLNREDGQIVFVDTPGMHKPKNRLGEFMVEEIDETMPEMDVILMMIDGSEGVGPGDEFMASRLPEQGVKILLINKLDKMTPESFEAVSSEAKQLADFSEVLGISALDGVTIAQLPDLIMDYLPEGPAYFPEEQWTNLDLRTITSEIIREKALMYLDQEIPHGIAVVIDTFEEEPEIVNIQATIIVERDSHKGIVIGKGGRKLKGIGQEARKDIEQLLEKKVFLELWVKVRENWRRSAHHVADFGYRK